MRTASLSWLMLLTSLSTGCTDEAQTLSHLASVIETPSVREHIGCRDMELYVRDEASTVSLIVLIEDGIVADTVAQGSELTRSYTLPHPAVTVISEWGDGVTLDRCTDWVEVVPTVRGTATAISGTLDVTMQPNETRGRADIHWSDLLLQGDAGGTIQSIPPATLEEVDVGWLPG